MSARESNRSRYVSLAVLALIAFSFQATVLVENFSDLLAEKDPVAALFTTPWIIGFVLHVFTALACLVLGFYVTFVRIEDLRAWLLLAVLVSFSINADGSDLRDRIMNWATPLKHFAIVYRTAVMRSWPIWMVVFSIYFPERATIDVRRPVLKWVVLTPLLIAWLLAVTVRVALNEGGHLEQLAQPLQRAAYIAVLFLYWLCFPVFLIVLISKVGRERQPDAQRRLRVLFSGLAISVLPAFTFGIIVQDIFHIREDSIPVWIIVPAVLTLALFPVTLAYVTVVQRALDVRVILRQSVQYALAKRGLVVLQGIISLIVIVCIALFSARTTLAMRILITAVGVGVVLSIGLGARRIARWIDRRFFREAYQTEQALTGLAESISSIVELGPLFRTVVERISEIFHVSEVVVFLRDTKLYRPVFAIGYPYTPTSPFDADAALVRELKAEARAMRVHWQDRRSWLNTVGDSDTANLSELKTEMLVPVCRQDKLLAFLSLGAKASEAPYTNSDVQLLQSVASQTALAIENSQLTESIAAEAAEREIINRELSIARDVQRRLFPQVRPVIPGVEYTGFCRPAREVGGDYYDYFALPENGLGIAIGDVSGKGIPAALLMASLQASLRSQTLSGERSIEELLSNLNNVIYATSPENRYATFFYGHYREDVNCLTYINAGHNAPMVVRAPECGHGVVRLEASGPPVGLFAECEYKCSEINLSRGDLLVLYTDGISEAMNANDEEWGEERMIDTVRECAHSSSAQMVERLFEAADAFAAGAPQHDDMTLMVFRFGET